ncbi:MAB_1171c family putative transporter [Streptomyces sp. NBC_00083]|uniref:MAB_1171c family putative transporter n=1 Tax=Streptomyces sp. NBC_00083 TaxID=2975647 RepID=UPI0022502B0F|nr:MAB_1171c family putative transporter [Streptomyces sp. NBC_00083]MCX5386237.1 regulator component [Streptomyces sp. NBC_00083]
MASERVVDQLADTVGLVSMVVLWAALVWRALPALRRPAHRGLWLTVLSATIAITLFQPKVVGWLVSAGAGVHLVSLTRNVLGVLSAGLVLLFVIDSTRSRRLRPTVVAGLVAAMGALLVLDRFGVAQSGSRMALQGPADPSTLYWLILVAAHLLGDAVAVVVCWEYSRRADDRDLVWSLRLFAAGSVLAIVFWSGYLLNLCFHTIGTLPYLSLVISVHGLFRAASLLVPTATACARSVSDLRTTWRLWPLWRDLVVAVPQVTLTKPQRSRVQDVLRPRSPLSLQAHRQTIETYDAMLELQQYVRPDAYEQALLRARHAGLYGDRLTAAALAGALDEARRAKLAGAPPSAPRPLPGVDRGSTVTLLAIARIWPAVSGRAAAGAVRPG